MSTHPIHIKSIAHFHKIRGLQPPAHPLISVINYGDIREVEEGEMTSFLFDFYLISVKKGLMAQLIYGHQNYDHDSGAMSFMAPHQLLQIKKADVSPEVRSGWMLLVHPDFLWNSKLATTINGYEFFGYSSNEALFLSDKEEHILKGLVGQIKDEYSSNLDGYSQSIILSHIETLLQYSERFYHRQFLTRQKDTHEISVKMERLLQEYFSSSDCLDKGLPTVQYFADMLHVSPNYLSSLLKSYTGLNAQQHIQDKLVVMAKEKLTTTEASISEIAFQLGFEHSQSFSRFFKSKTNNSPKEFRQLFN